MSNRFTMPVATALDNSARPGSGWKLQFYESGTTTPLDTYSDEAQTTPNANPVVADSAGRFGNIFLQNQAYRVVLLTDQDVQVWTRDDADGHTASGIGFDPTGLGIPGDPTQMQALGEALAAGAILLAGYAEKTDTQTANIDSGDSLDISGLSVAVTPATETTRYKLTATISFASDENNVGLAFRRGSTLFPLGDGAGDRVRAFQGVRIEEDSSSNMQTATLVAIDTPGTTSEVTYGVSLINSFVSPANLHVNRTRDDADNTVFVRTVSTLLVERIVE